MPHRVSQKRPGHVFDLDALCALPSDGLRKGEMLACTPRRVQAKEVTIRFKLLLDLFAIPDFVFLTFVACLNGDMRVRISRQQMGRSAYPLFPAIIKLCRSG